MKTVSRTVTGALAAALLTTAVATPADAQNYRRYRDYDRGNGISLGDVVLGTIIVGGVATAIGALSSGNRNTRGYDSRYGGNRDGDRQASVEACAYEAEREAGRRFGGRAQVRDIDVDRGRNGYRVRGTVEVQSDYRHGRDGYGRDGYGRDGYGRDRYDRERVQFNCEAYGSRVTGLSIGSNYAQGY